MIKITKTLMAVGFIAVLGNSAYGTQVAVDQHNLEYNIQVVKELKAKQEEQKAKGRELSRRDQKELEARKERIAALQAEIGKLEEGQ